LGKLFYSIFIVLQHAAHVEHNIVSIIPSLCPSNAGTVSTYEHTV